MLPDSGVVQRVVSPDTSMETLIPRTVTGEVLGMCLGLGSQKLYVFKSKLSDLGVLVSLHCSVVNSADGAVTDELVDGSPTDSADQAVMIEWQGNQYVLMATDSPPDGDMQLYKREAGVWTSVTLPGSLTQAVGRALAIFTVSGTEYLFLLCDDDVAGDRVAKMLRYDGTTVTVDHTFDAKTIPRSMLVTENGLMYLFNAYTTTESDGLTCLGIMDEDGTYNDALNTNALHRAGIALGMRVFDGSLFVAHAANVATNGKLYRSSDRLAGVLPFELAADLGHTIPVSGSSPDCQMAVA